VFSIVESAIDRMLYSSRRHAFTLIEILVVIAMIEITTRISIKVKAWRRDEYSIRSMADSTIEKTGAKLCVCRHTLCFLLHAQVRPEILPDKEPIEIMDMRSKTPVIVLLLSWLALTQQSWGQRSPNWRAFKLGDGLPESACNSVVLS